MKSNNLSAHRLLSDSDHFVDTSPGHGTEHISHWSIVEGNVGSMSSCLDLVCSVYTTCLIMDPCRWFNSATQKSQVGLLHQHTLYPSCTLQTAVFDITLQRYYVTDFFKRRTDKRGAVVSRIIKTPEMSCVLWGHALSIISAEI